MMYASILFISTLNVSLAANGTTSLQPEAPAQMVSQTASTGTAAEVADPIAQDKEFITALNRMREKGLTRFSSPSAYAPYDLVTREQAAKFYSEFSVNVLYKIMDMNKYCEFDDLVKADKTLKNSILVSCMLSLFK